MATALPARFGPYRPLRKLGQGGMGVVYAAQDERTPARVVALKVLLTGPARELDDSGRRFLREARILEKLRHPNIVTFYDIGVTNGQTWFAMELLEGRTLSAYMGRPWRELLPFFVQVCRGLEYLATQSIVHRDLSLDNVFVLEAGNKRIAKILDFGIAKWTESEETLHDFTKTGLLMGKPYYWSPEQLGSLPTGQKMDFRSDMYALGVMFYRLLSRELPINGDSPLAFASAHLTDTPAPLVAAPGNPELPPALTSLVMRMLEKDREARPQSYAEIIGILRSELGETVDELLGIEAPIAFPDKHQAGSESMALPPPNVRRTLTRPWDEPVLETGVTTRLPDAPDRRGPRVAALAAAAVLLVGGGLWLARGRGTEPPPAQPARSTGSLAIDAMPWARVTSVTDLATNQRVPLPEGLTTPAILDVPPGRYAVEVLEASSGATKRVEMSVAAEARTAEIVAFASPEDALKLLEPPSR